MVKAFADAHGAVADSRAEVSAVTDLLEHFLHRTDISPVHPARIHEHRDGRARLDSVDADLVAKTVEFCDVLPTLHSAVRAKNGKRLKLQRRCQVVTVRIVDHIAALHDAAGHAVVHTAAARGEAGDDLLSSQIGSVR